MLTFWRFLQAEIADRKLEAGLTGLRERVAVTPTGPLLQFGARGDRGGWVCGLHDG